jgi:hypothetical protein
MEATGGELNWDSGGEDEKLKLKLALGSLN